LQNSRCNGHCRGGVDVCQPERDEEQDEREKVKKKFLHCASGSNFMESELMQYRSPVGGGPSGKTWPRCESQTLHSTSVRTMPWLVSGSSRILSGLSGAK